MIKTFKEDDFGLKLLHPVDVTGFYVRTLKTYRQNDELF